MAKWKQYELWTQTGESKWEMIGIFPESNLPTTLAKSRQTRSRLIEVHYDGSKMLSQEVIAETGQLHKKEEERSTKRKPSSRWGPH
jgi:hypothetical protein